MVSAHTQFALDHPVYDPTTQILPEHFWRIEHDVSAGLTVNIGLE